MNEKSLIELLQNAQKIALEKHGVSNILQPGVVKELMMAEVLGHDLVPQKDSADNVLGLRSCFMHLDRNA